MNLLLRCLAMISMGLLLGAPAAFGDTIPFFNTGVGPDGALLAAGVNDPHYTLIYNPDGATETAMATAPHPAWASNTQSAGWISPGSSGTQSWNSGYYIYETTFDLGMYDPSTASLSGTVAADDAIRIYLNRGGPALFSVSNFQTPAAFTINSGFQSGVNTVDFVVYNGSGPTGLLVDNTLLIANAEAPEPGALVLVATGCFGLYGCARQKMRRMTCDELQGNLRWIA